MIVNPELIAHVAVNVAPLPEPPVTEIGLLGNAVYKPNPATVTPVMTPLDTV